MKIIISLLLLIAPLSAITLEDIQKGADAVIKHQNKEDISEEEFVNGMKFVDFVEDFYRWIPMISLIEEDGVAEGKGKQMLATDDLRPPRFFSKSISEFIIKHRPPGADMKIDEGHALVYAWYLNTHPKSGPWQKLVSVRLLEKAFGKNFLGRTELDREIDAMKLKEIRGY